MRSRIDRVTDAVLHSRIVGVAFLVAFLPFVAMGWIDVALACLFFGIVVLTGWSPSSIWWNGRTDPMVLRERERHERRLQEDNAPD